MALCICEVAMQPAYVVRLCEFVGLMLKIWPSHDWTIPDAVVHALLLYTTMVSCGMHVANADRFIARCVSKPVLGVLHQLALDSIDNVKGGRSNSMLQSEALHHSSAS